jgi:H/ACA ribonucleoprotein complex subunit 3
MSMAGQHLLTRLFVVVAQYFIYQKESPDGKRTESAHPARFSPDDKFSQYRVALKKRFGIYLPDRPGKPL